MVQEKVINEVTRRLVQTYDPLKIYLFGSYAWGHPTEESDLDLLIIVDKSDEKSFKRAVAGHLALFGLNISKDILVYTKDEFAYLAGNESTLAYRVKKEGKVVYAKA